MARTPKTMLKGLGTLYVSNLRRPNSRNVDLGTAKRAIRHVRVFQFGLNPLHQTLVVKKMLARCLANLGIFFIVLNANAACLLVLLVLAGREFYFWKFFASSL